MFLVVDDSHSRWSDMIITKPTTSEFLQSFLPRMVISSAAELRDTDLVGPIIYPSMVLPIEAVRLDAVAELQQVISITSGRFLGFFWIDFGAFCVAWVGLFLCSNFVSRFSLLQDGVEHAGVGIKPVLDLPSFRSEGFKFGAILDSLLQPAYSLFSIYL